MHGLTPQKIPQEVNFLLVFHCNTRLFYLGNSSTGSASTVLAACGLARDGQGRVPHGRKRKRGGVRVIPTSPRFRRWDRRLPCPRPPRTSSPLPERLRSRGAILCPGPRPRSAVVGLR